MIKLFLIRGLPGCGKTDLARFMGGSGSPASADDFFVVDGIYDFDPSKLPDAHAWCLDKATKRITLPASAVVHNTFTQRWEMQPYIDMAILNGARLVVISLFDGGCTDEQLAERNSHGVPADAIAEMRERFEHDWKIGNPLPPWER